MHAGALCLKAHQDITGSMETWHDCPRYTSTIISKWYSNILFSNAGNFRFTNIKYQCSALVCPGQQVSNTCTPTHSCSYLISKWCGSSAAMYNFMQIQASNFG